MADRVDVASKKYELDSDFIGSLAGPASSKVLKDFYLVGLWSYCEGERIDGVAKITYCSSSRYGFWFNVIDVWGLEDTLMQRVLGNDLQKGLEVYRKVARWTSTAFTIAVISIACELVASAAAVFSRAGSLVAFILSAVSCSSDFCIPAS